MARCNKSKQQIIDAILGEQQMLHQNVVYHREHGEDWIADRYELRETAILDLMKVLEIKPEGGGKA